MRSRCPLRNPKKARSRTQRRSTDADGFVAVGGSRLKVSSTPPHKEEERKVGLENSFSGLDVSDDEAAPEPVPVVPDKAPSFREEAKALVGFTPQSGSLWADASDDEE